MTDSNYTLEQYPEQVAIVRLGPGSPIPGWAESSSIFSVVATAAETTVVCAARDVPKKVPHERSFTAFAVAGSMAWPRTGDLLALLAPVAEAGIEALPVTTFETLWFLVRKPQADEAAEQWRRRGHTVTPADPATSA